MGLIRRTVRLGTRVGVGVPLVHAKSKKQRVAKSNKKAAQQQKRRAARQPKTQINVVRRPMQAQPVYVRPVQPQAPAAYVPNPAAQQRAPLPSGIRLSPDGQHVLIENEWKPFAHNHMGAFWFNGQGWVTL